MGSRVQYIKTNNKWAIRIGNRRILATDEDTAELLAELQVAWDERCIYETEKQESQGEA